MRRLISGAAACATLAACADSTTDPTAGEGQVTGTAVAAR
jgi:hypothetical protein